MSQQASSPGPPPAAWSARDQRRLLEELELRTADGRPAPRFCAMLAAHGVEALHPAQLEVLQLNLGRLCNMSCRHCHVDAGPQRTEVMSRATAAACVGAMDRWPTVHTVDLTGGAPELNPSFRYLVEQAAARGKQVIDRCNLTVLLLPELAGLPQWLAERGVELVASLPHHRAAPTDALRGAGAFARSIEALRLLNAAGYGQGDPRRRLTLMTNPAGAFLAGDQGALQREWQGVLLRDHGVVFDRLFALNNMPIARFLRWLQQTGNTRGYLERLVRKFNPQAVAGLMCLNTVSVGWDGRVYDCDFNQMLATEADLRQPRVDAVAASELAARRIRTGMHCYGCTAGRGSSCAGATS